MCLQETKLILVDDDVTPCSGEPFWWLTTVYGPQEDEEKVNFLDELEAVRDACSGPWAVADLMLILWALWKERNNRLAHQTSTAQDLQERIKRDVGLWIAAGDMLCDVV